MAKGQKKQVKPTKEQQNHEIFEALRFFEAERGIPIEYMIEKIGGAITVAVKNANGGNDDVIVDIAPEENKFDVFLRKAVVEEVVNPYREMLPEEARLIDPTAEVEGMVLIPLEPKEIGRISAMTAKHVIRQGIREVERSQVLAEMNERNHEIVSAVIDRIDDRNGTAMVKIGKFDVPLPRSEQVPGEELYEGDIIKVFVADIKEGDRGPRAVVSRTHPGLVKRLFENEVPEIYDGTVTIDACSREAGSRTKIAVSSTDDNVDPIGACIGVNRSRINKVMDELGGEKIDIVHYSENPAEFIAEALSPARVLAVEVDEEQSRACRVIVPREQLSLAIGNKGQNARLAAKLTGWRIDIRPND
ncbi:MAG: transcription termination factor NusA [Oscillospiraceae bacterium]|nr:transcription termination factor NusA [Oscillospiraceae bacterium]